MFEGIYYLETKGISCIYRKSASLAANYNLSN